MLDELADCALMLLTTLPELSSMWSYEQMHTPHDWGFIGLRISVALDLFSTVWEWEHDVYLALISIATFPGMDLPARLTSRLDAIKAKRLPQGQPDADGVVKHVEVSA